MMNVHYKREASPLAMAAAGVQSCAPPNLKHWRRAGHAQPDLSWAFPRTYQVRCSCGLVPAVRKAVPLTAAGILNGQLIKILRLPAGQQLKRGRCRCREGGNEVGNQQAGRRNVWRGQRGKQLNRASWSAPTATCLQTGPPSQARRQFLLSADFGRSRIHQPSTSAHLAEGPLTSADAACERLSAAAAAVTAGCLPAGRRGCGFSAAAPDAAACSLAATACSESSSSCSAAAGPPAAGAATAAAPC